jgi:GDP-L-fucose synthase
MRQKKTNAPVTLGKRNTNESFFVDDMAQAVVFALENKLPDYLYNVGTGEDLTIKPRNHPKNNRTPRRNHLGCHKTRWYTPKINGISKMHALGWKHQVQLEEGIQKTYNWFWEYR